jgi:hypothetical protein
VLDDRVLHQRRTQLEVVLADVRRRARHPQRAVLDLLAQLDEKRAVVGELEAPRA